MKRVLGISLAVMASVLVLATPAQSAEIPPTPACESAAKALLDRYYDETPAFPTEGQMDRAGRRFAERLAQAGCVSDAEPLVRKIRAKPFTPQCSEAAARAEAFVGPKTAMVNRLTRKFIRQVKRPFQERRKVLKERKARFKARNKPQLVAMIDRKLERLRDTYWARDRAYGKRVIRVFEEDGFAFYLTLAELRSLLCIGFDSPFARGKGPGQRFASNNSELLFSAIFYIAITGYVENQDSASAASRFDPPRNLGIEPAGGIPLLPTDRLGEYMPARSS
jgi:hypothetical protein